MELHKLQVLARQARPGDHGVPVSCAGVGGGAAEEGTAVTPVGRGTGVITVTTGFRLTVT